MKATNLLLSLLSIVLLFDSCKKEDAQPVQIADVLIGGDFETSPYTSWRTDVNKNNTTRPTSYTVDYSTEAASSPTHSIKVSCNVAQNDSTYQLFQQYHFTSDTPIPTGAKLTLKVKIKTLNIQGNGISIAIGGNLGVNDNYASAFFTSTEGKIPITGTNDFKEYTITYDSFPAKTYSFYALIFFLPKTTGTAYYDDVSLSVN
ncbi:hypothetical protein GO730_09230 [Spirosoma sp. HMF3257]|uniref:Uncharacterized protein n=1 Tax=Spirosoma telluris TaxID=2183553 RepID=A0A327NKG7_9BACT|nr:hypothetical protein [Spirosoma telluris]RAI74414.1 hypothetical protein HMF3257_09140 [Spirosoma telluris]